MDPDETGRDGARTIGTVRELAGRYAQISTDKTRSQGRGPSKALAALAGSRGRICEDGCSNWAVAGEERAGVIISSPISRIL